MTTLHYIFIGIGVGAIVMLAGIIIAMCIGEMDDD